MDEIYVILCSGSIIIESFYRIYGKLFSIIKLTDKLLIGFRWNILDIQTHKFA